MRKSAKFILMALVLVAGVGAGCSRQARSARHFERANRYYAAGQYDRAEIEYINALRLHPEKSPAFGRLGLIYFEQGRVATAVPFLLRGRQAEPGNLELRLKLGLIYLAAGKRQEAQDEARAVLSQRPQDRDAIVLLAESAARPKEVAEVRARLAKLAPPEADNATGQFVLGRLAFRQHDLPAAEAAFKRAQALDPKWNIVPSILGAMYAAQNKLPEAEQAFKTGAELSPARSPIRLEYAQFKIRHGDVPGGKRLLEEMVRQAPDYVPGWLNLAEIAAVEKRYDECSVLLERVLARDRENFGALVLHARLRLARNEPAKAQVEFEDLAKAYPQMANIHYQLATVYLVVNETSKAVASLNRAVSLDPDALEPALLLAETQFRTRDLPGAVLTMKRLIQQRPNLRQARLMLANVYRAQGNLDEALDVCRQVAAAAPQDAPTHLLMGIICLQQGKKEQGRQAFGKALDLAPGSLPPLEFLVNLDLSESQFVTARQRVEKQQERNPQRPEFQLLLARIAAAQKDLTGAETALLKAIEVQPDFRPACLMLAQLYVQSQQEQKALERLQQVLAKNPKDISALMLVGMIHDNRKNYAAARDAYEKLLAIDPKSGPALNNLAYLYSERLGQLDKGYEMARRARDLQPGDPYTADTLGWILYQKGQYSWAVNLLEESAAKLPAQPSVQAHLGLAHYMMGDETAARAAFETARQITQEFPERDEVARRLSVLAIDVQTAGPDTRASLEKMLAQKPDDLVAMARLAGIYERDGATNKAVGVYESALKANPKNVRALLNLARRFAARIQDAPRAFELAKTAYKLAPDDQAVVRVLGRLAYQAGDYKWALSLLQESAAKQAGDPELLCDLAQARYSQGQTEEAAAAMRSALESSAPFSRAAEAKRFLDLLALADDPARASAAADRVGQIVKSEPDYVPALIALAALSEQKSDGAAAKQAYEKALSRFPDFVPAKRRLAILLAADPREDQRAYALASMAREAFPDDPELAKALGIITYRQGNYARSASLLKESAGKRTGDAQLVYYLGMAQYRLKQRAQSKQSLQHALELNLPGELAGEAKRVLAELK